MTKDKKRIRSGLVIISLHRLLQGFSMRQTHQRDYHNLADASFGNQLSAVETRLDCIPLKMAACSTFWRQTIRNKPIWVYFFL